MQRLIEDKKKSTIYYFLEYREDALNRENRGKLGYNFCYFFINWKVSSAKTFRVLCLWSEASCRRNFSWEPEGRYCHIDFVQQ